jgi:tetratricopeptide (TPR) repeat protein
MRTEGLKLVRAGKFDEGMPILREAAAGDPSNPMVWENIGEAERVRGNWTVALEAVERGLALRPRNPNLNIYKGALLVELGRADEAVHHFEGLLDWHPDPASIHYNIGDAQASAGRRQEALNHYNQAEKLGMRSPLVPFQRGMNLYQAGRYGEAVEAFREAVQLKPDMAEAWLNIGVNSLRLNRNEEADEAYRKAIELSGSNGQIRAMYGYFLTQTRRYEEAQRQLNQALKLDPNSVWVHTNLAWFHCKGDREWRDTEKALRHSARAVELAGANPPANVLNTRAEALSAAGEHDEALAVNARLRAAHPDDGYYQNQQRRFESARTYITPEQEKLRGGGAPGKKIP